MLNNKVFVKIFIYLIFFRGCMSKLSCGFYGSLGLPGLDRLQEYRRYDDDVRYHRENFIFAVSEDEVQRAKDLSVKVAKILGKSSIDFLEKHASRRVKQEKLKEQQYKPLIKEIQSIEEERIQTHKLISKIFTACVWVLIVFTFGIYAACLYATRGKEIKILQKKAGKLAKELPEKYAEKARLEKELILKDEKKMQALKSRVLKQLSFEECHLGQRALSRLDLMKRDLTYCSRIKTAEDRKEMIEGRKRGLLQRAAKVVYRSIGLNLTKEQLRERILESYSEEMNETSGNHELRRIDEGYFEQLLNQIEKGLKEDYNLRAKIRMAQMSTVHGDFPEMDIKAYNNLDKFGIFFHFKPLKDGTIRRWSYEGLVKVHVKVYRELLIALFHEELNRSFEVNPHKTMGYFSDFKDYVGNLVRICFFNEGYFSDTIERLSDNLMYRTTFEHCVRTAFTGFTDLNRDRKEAKESYDRRSKRNLQMLTNLEITQENFEENKRLIDLNYSQNVKKFNKSAESIINHLKEKIGAKSLFPNSVV